MLNNEQLCKWLVQWMQQEDTWRNYTIAGYLKAKNNSTSLITDLRAVLPRCPFGQICDCLLRRGEEVIRLGEFLVIVVLMA